MLEIAGGLIILLFTYAALTKAISFRHFSQQLDNQPLPKSLTPFLAYAIPIFEGAIIVLLVIPAIRLWGFVASAVFMLAFTTYTAIILLHGFSYIPCSCGGVIEQLNWQQHLALNTFYLTLSIAGIWLSARSRKQNI